MDVMQTRAAAEPFYGPDPSVTMIDFALWRAWDGVTQTERPVTDALACVRATPGWAVDDDGGQHAFTAGALRRSNRGLLIERTVVNQFAQPDAPVTRTIPNLAAGHYLLWMLGSGSLTTSGSATVVSGPNPVTEGLVLRLALAATGSLTVTVTGDVAFVQLEQLPATTRPSLPSSPVHGAGATNTRDVDQIAIQGFLRTAMLRAPATLVFEWFEPGLRWDVNRRLFRGSGGAQTFTAVVNSAGKLNASLATAAGAQFNLTCNTIVGPTAEARAHVAMATDNATIAIGSEVLPADTACTMLFDAIATLGLGARDDTHEEDFNGYLSKIIVHPRRLTDAEMATQSTTDLPFPALATYPAIAPTGGEGGPTYTITATGQVAARLQLANRRKVRIAPTLTGREPYADTVTVRTGDLTFRGHPRYWTFAGGGFVVGDDTHQPRNIIFEDLNFGPGNDDIGRPFEDRDGLGIWSCDTLVVRHCNFAYAVDELASVYKGLAAARGIRNVLFEYCVFGPSLAAPVDSTGAYRKGEVPHNMGLLVADGITNVVVRFCLFAGNVQRNPTFGVVFGGFAYNNILYDWQQYGMLVVEPRDQFQVRGLTVAFVGCLLKPGPNTGPTARASGQAMLRVGDGSAVHFSGNALTNLATFASDVILNGDTDVALFKGANRLSLSPSMPFVSPYSPMPTATAAQRQAVANLVLGNAGVRYRDATGAVIPGDAGAAPFTLAVLNAVRNGVGMKISAESEFGGFLI